MGRVKDMALAVHKREGQQQQASNVETSYVYHLFLLRGDNKRGRSYDRKNLQLISESIDTQPKFLKISRPFTLKGIGSVWGRSLRHFHIEILIFQLPINLEKYN